MVSALADWRLEERQRRLETYGESVEILEIWHTRCTTLTALAVERTQGRAALLGVDAQLSLLEDQEALLGALAFDVSGPYQCRAREGRQHMDGLRVEAWIRL
jgi:hypothetical protein